MHSSGSVLQTIVSRIRHLGDIPDTDRHPDSFYVNELIATNFPNLLARLSLSDEHPVLLMHAISLTAGTARYILPPNVGNIWRLGKLDDDGRVTHDMYPRWDSHPNGPNWAVEGNELVIRPYPQQDDEDWLLFYTPTGDVQMHTGSGTVTNASNIILSSAPTLGQLDQRLSAYEGMVLRIIHAGRVHQERVISQYDATTRTATVRVAFQQGATSLPDNAAAVTYEVCMTMSNVMVHALAALCAMSLGSSKEWSQKKMAYLEAEFLRCQKTLHDGWSNMIARRSKSFEKNTIDHPRFNDPTGLVIYGLNAPFESTLPIS